MNQLYIYICPHISSLLHLPPSHPPYPTPLGGQWFSFNGNGLFYTLADDAKEFFEKIFISPLIYNFLRLDNSPNLLDVVLVRVLQRNRTNKNQ